MAENWNVHGVYWLLRNASNSGALEDDEYQPLPTKDDAEFIANAPTLADELVAARARIAELEAKLATPDMFWDHDDPEAHTYELMETAHDAGPGCICQIMRAVSLPDVYTVWLPPIPGSDNKREFVCATAEEAEAWLKAQRAADALQGDKPCP
jgi:hypothetical protein